MLKKSIYLLPFFVMAFLFNAVAAPSIGLLKQNKSNTNIAKTAAITPKKQPVATPNIARAIQNSNTSNLNKASSAGSARLPALLGKIPLANQNTNTNTNINTNISTKPVTSGVSESTFNSLVQRVEVLESKNENTIIDVVENGSGAYVNDVTKEGNELNVTKTDILYVPVKNASGTTVSGNAEIWIIK